MRDDTADLGPGQTIEQSCTQRSNHARSNIVRPFGRWAVRVCNRCARRIRNLGTLYKLVHSSIGSHATVWKTPPKQKLLRLRQQAFNLVI